MRFSPTSPYGERCIQDLVNHPDKPCTLEPWSGLEWRIDGTTDDKFLNQSEAQHPQENIAYRCSPVNPYFLGWSTILNALGTALQAVHDRYNDGLRLRELDAQNEMALETLPVRGRLIVDNTHGNYDVLGGLRALMQAKGFDPALVTYSVYESRTGHPPSGGVAWDYNSYWGDSARILGVSEIAAAIGGYRFGNTNGDWGCEIGGCGLRCGGEDTRMEYALPYGHSQSKIVDLHFSPCRIAQGVGGAWECAPTQWDEVNLESAKGLSELHDFQKSFYPGSFCQAYYPGDPSCGWRGSDTQLGNSLLMLGESQGHGLVPELQTPGNTNTNCALGDAFPGQNWDVRAGRNTAVGFNQSTLPNRNLPDGSPLWLIVRPWEYPQQTSTPPDPYYCNASRLDSMYIPTDGTVTNQAPTVVSVAPSSGNGANQTFSLVYTDANTYLDLSLTSVLVNSSLSFANGCYVEYNRTTNQLRLRNNGGNGWLGPVSLGAGGLQNSQCAIDPGGAKSETGNTLTLNLPLRFFTGFSGAKNVYLLAQDLGGLSSSWQLRGTWTVSSCTYSIAPSSQAFPASGGNGSVTVTAGPTCAWTATSNEGWVSITSGGSGTGNGTVSYSVQANTGGSRQGMLIIAGKTFTVTQEAPLADLYLQNLTHTSGIWFYQATNSVVAENGVTIGGSASVTFQAGSFIRLGPGFHATAGSAATTFRTIIGP